MAVVRMRGRGYRLWRWVNETAATIEQGGAVLATCWCAKVFLGATPKQRVESSEAAVGRSKRDWRAASNAVRSDQVNMWAPFGGVSGKVWEQAASKSLPLPCTITILSTLVCVRLGEEVRRRLRRNGHISLQYYSCFLRLRCKHAMLCSQGQEHTITRPGHLA
jgi:hypothetical protein